ncbi:hypothetical protein L1987_79965 [Smallanthus sonchifolius]|uniref:Uncharacterized protein n=1 Tax=Smallanthus sonchifolius TaxID=185202 RepID=A0ACB8YMF2_9ASTR|nr:hypothetical protein L1987_79965 [Smallanthus sonchifolius]
MYNSIKHLKSVTNKGGYVDVQHQMERVQRKRIRRENKNGARERFYNEGRRLGFCWPSIVLDGCDGSDARTRCAAGSEKSSSAIAAASTNEGSEDDYDDDEFDDIDESPNWGKNKLPPEDDHSDRMNSFRFDFILLLRL